MFGMQAGAEYALSAKMDSPVREDLISMLAKNWFDSADGHHVTLRSMSDLSWKSYEIYLRDIIRRLLLLKNFFLRWI
jgi:hypothetical protein